MALEQVTIKGRKAMVGYFDQDLVALPSSKGAIWAKAVFEDGSRTFYVVTDARKDQA